MTHVLINHILQSDSYNIVDFRYGLHAFCGHDLEPPPPLRVEERRLRAARPCANACMTSFVLASGSHHSAFPQESTPFSLH